MAIKIISATHRGLDGVLISVEVDIKQVDKTGLYTQLY